VLSLRDTITFVSGKTELSARALPLKDVPEVTEYAPRDHVRPRSVLPEKPPETEVRAPLVVRSFEDLPSRQPTGAGFNPAAFRHGISFRYGVDDDRGRAADRERRVHLTA